jgi:hypothetical protein
MFDKKHKTVKIIPRFMTCKFVMNVFTKIMSEIEIEIVDGKLIIGEK